MFIQFFAIVALRYAFRFGIAPEGMMVRRALAALKKDDLDLAVDTYFELAKKDFSSEKVQVLREILISEIKFRKQALQKRLYEIESKTTDFNGESKQEKQAGARALKILDRFLNRLGVGLRETG